MGQRGPDADDQRRDPEDRRAGDGARRRQQFGNRERAERRFERVERVGEDGFELDLRLLRFSCEPRQHGALGLFQRAPVLGLGRQRHDDALAFEGGAVLGEIIADERKLAAHARDRPDPRRARARGAGGENLAGGEDEAGVAPEGLAQRGDGQPEAGRARVAVAEAAELKIGNAQMPGLEARVARAQPQTPAPRLDEAHHRLARALADAVEAEVEQFCDLRHEAGGMVLRRSLAGDRLEQMRRLAMGIDERYKHAGAHGSMSSTSIWASSASSNSSAAKSRRTMPKRSNAPSPNQVSPARARAGRPA